MMYDVRPASLRAQALSINILNIFIFVDISAYQPTGEPILV